MSKCFDDLIDQLLDGPYHVADVLPRQVPKDAEGQCFAVERYFTEPGRLARILEKHAEILLGLNCYYDMEITCDGGDSWEKNPAPEKLSAQVTRLSAGGFLRVVFPSAKALIDIDSGDTWMTVYGGSPDFLETAAKLSAAAGLFLWEPVKD